MELKRIFQNKGYGFSALNLFIEKISELTGHKNFCAFVDLENKASQKLLKKCGVEPDDKREYMVVGGDLLKYKKEEAQAILHFVRQVAEELDIEIEDLFRETLEYHIKMV